MVSPGQHIYDFPVPEYVELSEQLHHQMMACAIFSSPDILVEVLAGQISGRRPLARVPYGRRREVDADTLVSKTRKPVGVKSRPAAKIEYSTRLVAKQGVMNPGHVCLDSLGASACGVVILGEMLLEHTMAEIRVVPRNFFVL